MSANIRAAQFEVIDDRTSIKLKKALNDLTPIILATIGDMLRFPFATLYLPVLLNAPEVGGMIALRQNLGFVPAVLAIYAVSNLQSVAYGRGESAYNLAAIRRAGDVLSIKIGAVTSIALLALAFIPLGETGNNFSVIRDFFLSYFPGAIPALWVVVRQENLLAASQAWSLVGLNFLNLAIMMGTSFGLTKAIGGVGLGLGFVIPTLTSLGFFELFLAKNSLHENSVFSRFEFSNSPTYLQASRELNAKAWHSALIYMGGTIGFWSTFLVPFMKNPDAQNIANGALNQFFYFNMVIGTQIGQILTAKFVGYSFGILKNRKKFQPELFDLRKAKKGLACDLILILGVSLLWPASLSAMLPLFKTPALHFLTSGHEAHWYPLVADSVDAALPYVALSAASVNLTTMLFTAKRTLDGASKSDSLWQIAAGLLTFSMVALSIFALNAENLGDIWDWICPLNYIFPLLLSCFLTGRHLYQMTENSFVVREGALAEIEEDQQMLNVVEETYPMNAPLEYEKAEAPNPF